MQPMIKVENLTKRYAGMTALNGLSFEVQRGEIVGFLGPNGAGKSTTMRILTGFIPASSGRVEVAGLDVFEHSLEVRERLIVRYVAAFPGADRVGGTVGIGGVQPEHLATGNRYRR